ncbi:hypothetical protein DFJ74DRAFT_684444 [Hyaloraphidium curvatum]|nr:hypothetical protein DFJ74DRAFT_684444 [Hyaloraphidium curvatum]
MPKTAKKREIRDHVIENLRNFTCYDLLPISYRLCVFDTLLMVTKALNIFLQNGIHAAPLWDSERGFAGMLTVTDFIKLIRHEYHTQSSYESAMEEIRQCTIQQMKDIHRRNQSHPSSLHSIHPMKSLFDCAQSMVKNQVNRMPLVDRDGHNEIVLGLVSQYKVLRFIAANFNDPDRMDLALRDLNIGTFGEKVARVTYDTPWIQVLDMFVHRGISAVPIVDHNDEVLDIYEKYDVIALAKEGGFHDLDIPVGEAVRFRSTTDQNRVHTCTMSDSLFSLLEAIREAKVHRFVIVEEQPAEAGTNNGSNAAPPAPVRKLIGILTLTDLLAFLVGLHVPRSHGA